MTTFFCSGCNQEKDTEFYITCQKGEWSCHICLDCIKEGIDMIANDMVVSIDSRPKLKIPGSTR